MRLGSRESLSLRHSIFPRYHDNVGPSVKFTAQDLGEVAMVASLRRSWQEEPASAIFLGPSDKE